MADAEASKNTFDSLLQNTDEKKISGYIQLINQNPFGILMQSDLQVFLLFFFNLFNLLIFLGETLGTVSRRVSSLAF